MLFDGTCGQMLTAEDNFFVKTAADHAISSTFFGVLMKGKGS